MLMLLRNGGCAEVSYTRRLRLVTSGSSMVLGKLAMNTLCLIVGGACITRLESSSDLVYITGKELWLRAELEALAMK